MQIGGITHTLLTFPVPLLHQETTPICHTWAQLPLASLYPFHCRKEEPGRTLHLLPALATKKGLPHLSVHRKAVKARRNLEHLIPRVILKPKAISPHFLKPTQDVWPHQAQPPFPPVPSFFAQLTTSAAHPKLKKDLSMIQSLPSPEGRVHLRAP